MVGINPTSYTKTPLIKLNRCPYALRIRALNGECWAEGLGFRVSGLGYVCLWAWHIRTVFRMSVLCESVRGTRRFLAAGRGSLLGGSWDLVSRGIQVIVTIVALSLTLPTKPMIL